MFGWFQRLLPERRATSSACSKRTPPCWSAAADASAATGVRWPGSTEKCLRTIQDREHVADDVIRDVLTTVRKTFLTPFDRGAITSLIGSMDDSIDEMLAAARAIDLYEVQQLRPEMKDIVALIAEAARVTQ